MKRKNIETIEQVEFDGLDYISQYAESFGKTLENLPDGKGEVGEIVYTRNTCGIIAEGSDDECIVLQQGVDFIHRPKYTKISRSEAISYRNPQ